MPSVTCARCQTPQTRIAEVPTIFGRVKKQSIEVPGIRFPWLTGHPWICERCVFEVFSGKRETWDAVNTFLKEAEGA